MITFKHIGYLGRLGNQMFQFASTLGIAKKLNLEAKFPIENCELYNNHIKCDLLDCFDIDPAYFLPGSEIIATSMYTEREFTFNEDIIRIPDSCTLYGYFQTDKYFNDSEDLIRSQFSFRKSHRDKAISYINNIRKNNINSSLTSIHVRRGDYVFSPDHHPVCSLEYYAEAVNKINESGNNKFIIFSDDIDWCKKAFIGDAYIFSDLANPYVEMCAMTLCDNNIMANSSFSWWGSWLNNNPKKIVISPSKWFGSAMNKDTSDVYCKNWIII